MIYIIFFFLKNSMRSQEKVKNKSNFLFKLKKNFYKNAKFMLLGSQEIELPLHSFVHESFFTPNFHQNHDNISLNSQNEFQSLLNYLQFVKKINKNFKKETDSMLTYGLSHVSKFKKNTLYHLQEENKDIFLLFKIHLEQREETFYNILKKNKHLRFTYDHQNPIDVLTHWQKMKNEKFFYIFSELINVRKKVEKILGKEHSFIAKQYINFHKNDPKFHI